MMRITFKFQMIVTAIVVIASFVLSRCLGKDIFYNLGWAFCGQLFAINPVYPVRLFVGDSIKAKKGVQIAGFILIFIGLTNGFGI